VPVGQFDDNFDPKISFYLQCGSPYLAYWNWPLRRPFSAGSMPRFPSSVGAENGCNRRVYLLPEGSHRPGTHNSKPRFGRGPRRQPPGRRIPRHAAGNIGPYLFWPNFGGLNLKI
jgi:hypothetical protein